MPRLGLADGHQGLLHLAARQGNTDQVTDAVTKIDDPILSPIAPRQDGIEAHEAGELARLKEREGAQ